MDVEIKAALESIDKKVSRLVAQKQEIDEVRHQMSVISLKHQEVFGNGRQFDGMMHTQSECIKRRDRFRKRTLRIVTIAVLSACVYLVFYFF